MKKVNKGDEDTELNGQSHVPEHSNLFQTLGGQEYAYFLHALSIKNHDYEEIFELQIQ